MEEELPRVAEWLFDSYSKWKTDKSGRTSSALQPTAGSDFKDARIALEMLPEISTLHFQSDPHVEMKVSFYFDESAALFVSCPPCATTFAHIKEMMEGNTTIRWVKFWGSNSATDCSVMVPEVLAMMRNVEQLNLWYFKRERLEAAMRMLRVFESPDSKLTTLALGHVDFTTEIAQDVARLVMGGKLERLYVRYGVESESMLYPLLEALRSTTSLQELLLEMRFEMNESAIVLFDVLRTNATLTSVTLKNFNSDLFPLMIDVFRDNHTLRYLRYIPRTPFKFRSFPEGTKEAMTQVVCENYTVVKLPKMRPRVAAMKERMACNAHNHAMHATSLAELLLDSEVLSDEALAQRERQTLFDAFYGCFRKRQITIE